MYRCVLKYFCYKRYTLATRKKRPKFKPEIKGRRIETVAVSDHYPVYAEFWNGRDGD